MKSRISDPSPFVTAAGWDVTAGPGRGGGEAGGPAAGDNEVELSRAAKKFTGTPLGGPRAGDGAHTAGGAGGDTTGPCCHPPKGLGDVAAACCHEAMGLCGAACRHMAGPPPSEPATNCAGPGDPRESCLPRCPPTARRKVPAPGSAARHGQGPSEVPPPPPAERPPRRAAFLARPQCSPAPESPPRLGWMPQFVRRRVLR
mmetsp:Transcript_6242/g.21429  ORF Transcript_6242/g.21429 Transcript_6242/m.21429 type:complete len:201 (+) Transcript_6242:616-1218(+)